MKYLFEWLSSWWFSAMAPAHAPQKSIQEREVLCKRRLLSLVLCIHFVFMAPSLPLGVFAGLHIGQVLLDILSCSATLFAFWINRRGYLRCASLVMLMALFLEIVVGTCNLPADTPFLALYFWPLLMLLPVTAALFLSGLETFFMGCVANGFMWWYVAFGCHSQIARYARNPDQQALFLGFALAIITATTLLSALQAWATNRAVIQADRAVELEQANQALTAAHKDLALAHAKIQKQALTDPLTELANHRAMLEQLEREIDRAQRFGRTVSVLFFDLDHFKALNDGYGHAAGDEALRAFGQLLLQQLRGIDTVGRWGGEEFIAILPETTVNEAQIVAERVRSVVNRHIFTIGSGLHLTCSIGIASYPFHVKTQSALIEAADQAMYAAKRLGRNQVRVIDEPVVQILLVDQEREGGREATALEGFVETLTSLVEMRDRALGDHSTDVADLVERLALKLGVNAREAHMMHLAGQLHDIGKMGVPDGILQKPARLTEEEWQLMKQHPAMGAEIITHIPSLRPLSPLIRAHHERWDGTGYPDRLKAEAIPLGARVIAVVDAYTAMTADRPYQQARSSEEALAELRRCAGKQFDPAVVEALAQVLHDTHKETPAARAA